MELDHVTNLPYWAMVTVENISINFTNPRLLILVRYQLPNFWPTGCWLVGTQKQTANPDWRQAQVVFRCLESGQ